MITIELISLVSVTVAFAIFLYAMISKYRDRGYYLDKKLKQKKTDSEKKISEKILQ